MLLRGSIEHSDPAHAENHDRLAFLAIDWIAVPSPNSDTCVLARQVFGFLDRPYFVGSYSRLEYPDGLLAIVKVEGNNLDGAERPRHSISPYCGGWPFEADIPPSTGRFTPVTNRASSLARKAMTAATSSGFPGPSSANRSLNLSMSF